MYPNAMTSQAADNKQGGYMFRKNRHQKHSNCYQSLNCDSESETAVTSTSGQKLNVPASRNIRRCKISKSSTISKSNTSSKALLSLESVVKSEHSSSPTKHHSVSSTTAKKKELSPVNTAAPDKMSDPGSSNQRLLMREWLIQEVSCNRIPELKWLDKSRKLIRIPWIHASKEGWSQDYHCKLFEHWAIYTGKYDPNKGKPEPKRWKANFRCALNSLPDVEEVPDMGQKNGMNGYKVYQFKDPAPRRSPKKFKHSHQSLHSESQQKNSPVEAALSVPSTETNSRYAEQFTDSYGKSLFPTNPGYTVIACNTELIHDTVQPSDCCFTSISSVDDGLIMVVVGEKNPEVEVDSIFPFARGNSASVKDIIVLRNMDHNYFKVQIPTTVENYEDDDSSSPTEPQLKMPRKNAVR